MLKKYVDLTYYLSVYKGKVPDFEFERMSVLASSFIQKETLDRISLKNIPEEVKIATCLIIDKMYEAEKNKKEIGVLQSSSIEGWSETYITSSNINENLKNECIEVLENMLSDTIGIDGNLLLYRGI